MGSEKMLKQYFDRVFTEADYVKKSVSILKKFGFAASNTIAGVDVCRDEISQPLVALIQEKWGVAFNLSSLAAMFFAGKTALMAAMHHSPVVEGRERYVFYAFPHIAVGSDGALGICTRRGRRESSSACGALNVFLGELKNKKALLSTDSEDIELSLIRARLLKEIPYGHVPDLLELTKITLKTIQADIEKALRNIVDKKKGDYAFLTGIQIHTPHDNYIWPDSSYVIANGERQKIVFA